MLSPTDLEVRRVEVNRLKARIEEMLIRGVTSRREIATRLGLKEIVVYAYVKQIYDRWELESTERLRDMRANAIRRMEKCASLAMTSYEESRRVVVTCKSCKGTGMKGETLDWCTTCDGRGTVEKKQAGDPTHLRVYLEGMREVARLQGLYGERGRKKKSEVNVNIMTGAAIVGIDLDKVPQDKLLAAMSAYDQLMEASKEGQVVLDVKPDNMVGGKP